MNSLNLNDLPFLKEESLRVFRWLVLEYPEIDNEKNLIQGKKDNQSEEKKNSFSKNQLEGNETSEFPIRWMMEQKGQRFEWVVSDMGSVTLRLGDVEGKRRNPAPIFYLSLRKLEEDVFYWTDPEGNPVPFPDPSILIDIQNRIQLYMDSIS
ncbi:hypothetical protein EHQ68_07495 [Leptospira congkakensis]|uniref:Uncharacterized protein n=1 Tax=Leptospira congkakensis TaxID=2484932 RepID=A0A4Z1A815_9LEPT|nr:hypothetical protein [Leptospira congkakensis]TGL87551.1 hypothetical protein EHQ69_15665 [Leptospira congkakensis]TGL89834.1 hypothetical protein EHQ68_07495 [Leptospira congkakensis]TGL95701.1 hypothetical protein EHQ70_11335 [Leptospira congkakensis]